MFSETLVSVGLLVEKRHQLDWQAYSNPRYSISSMLSLLHNDVIDTAHSAQPLSHGLANSDVSHVTGKLADAREHRWLEGCEGWVWKDLNLIENC